jgi:hemolysin III
MRTRDHFSAISHLLGAILSVVGMVVLIVMAARQHLVWHVVGFSVFGASVILLYAASATYHVLHISSRAKKVFKRLDHSFIYVLIAGTFTPLCLTVLRGPWGWSLLGVIWACAIAGIIMKNVWQMPAVLSTLLYIGMGWLALVPIVPLYRALPLTALAWLFFGGILYTLGTVFYGLDRKYPSHRWFNMHDLFHLFVMGGSLSHFVVMFSLV